MHTGRRLTEAIYFELAKARKKRQISINSVSKFLGVSTSGFYSFIKRTESKQSKRKKKVKTAMTEIYNKSNQIYGAPKITHLLKE